MSFLQNVYSPDETYMFIHLKEMVLQSIIDMSKDFSGKLHNICPHGLSIFTTETPKYKCDICGKSQPVGVTMYGCRECDWDKCIECHTAESNENGADSFGKALFLVLFCFLLIPLS